MDEISNTIGVNLVKVMFSIFLTLVIRNNLYCINEKRKTSMYMRVVIF